MYVCIFQKKSYLADPGWNGKLLSGVFSKILEEKLYNAQAIVVGEKVFWNKKQTWTSEYNYSGGLYNIN